MLSAAGATLSLVSASEPIAVSGTFSTVSTRTSIDKIAGDNIFTTYSGVSTWTGGISCPTGNGHGIQARISHFAGDPTSVPLPALLFFSMKVDSVLTSATVDGKTGDLTLKLIGIVYPNGATEGTWKIVSGTGALTNIHGGGTWGKGAGTGPSSYTGQVHFDP